MGATTRPAAAGDAVAGLLPRVVFEPASTQEASEALAQAAGEKLKLAVTGGRTALELGRPPSGLDAVVSTGRMARILEYAPSDMVIIAEAGVTLAQLQAAAREHKQRLALDAPFPERATIGGLVATGAAGPLRARYGTVRDLIIGVVLVRADGRVARSGGKVVKNVAGFDLPKVACGSLGTLGMIASANFRLHPLPEATAATLLPGLSAAQVPQLVGQIREAQLEPATAIALRSAAGTWDLLLGFEGFPPGVAQQLERLAQLARKAGCGCERLSDAAAAGLRARHDAVREQGALRAQVTALPSKLPLVEAAAARLLGALDGAGFAWYAATGAGWISGNPADVTAVSAALGDARAALARAGGALVLEAAPEAVRTAVDPWGPAPAAFPLFERLKAGFDPERRLNPGRFVGGL